MGVCVGVWMGDAAPDSSTSEATSIQMEFKYLAYLTDDPDLYRLADKSMHAIEHARHQLPAGRLAGRQEGGTRKRQAC